MDKGIAKLGVLVALGLGIVLALRYCFTSGPCACSNLPSFLQPFFCGNGGSGSGNGTSAGTGNVASQSIVDEFGGILDRLEQQTSTPQSTNPLGCSGTDCVPDQPQQGSGMLNVGGS